MSELVLDPLATTLITVPKEAPGQQLISDLWVADKLDGSDRREYAR
jgi:hypothetical protein